MKRKLLILSVLAICIATFAAGSLAYYTYEDTAHNVITSGGVKIAVQEWADEEETTPFEDKTGVMPSASVTKIAEVKNTGASEAWVRVKVEKAVEMKEGEQLDASVVSLDFNNENWTDGKDGYYYYNRALKAGEVTEPIFTKVTLDAKMDNSYQNAKISVDVLAQAVQTANNGESALKAAGWPSDGKA